MRERVSFEQLVRATGLSSIFAALTIKRVCERVGVSPDQLTRASIRQMLPPLEQALKLYMPPDEVARRLREISALAA